MAATTGDGEGRAQTPRTPGGEATTAPAPDGSRPRAADIHARPAAADGSRQVRAAMADAGLFGPDSITWRIHSDPLMGLAGLRALLLEAVHPVAIHVVEQYPGYRDDPWHRLARTAQYIGVTTYGSSAEAMLAGSRVRAVHARVRAPMPDGVEHSAEDPQLLAWVHCCLVASFLEIVTRGGLALTGAEQDAYVAEQVKAAMLVGLEPDEVPHDRAALLDYFAVIRPALEVTATARRAATAVVGPAVVTSQPPPVVAAPTASGLPSWAGVAGLAFAALPPWARRLYAIPQLSGAAGLGDAATTVALSRLRTALKGVQLVAPSLREGPHLRRLRQRLSC
jgi:uncharacterized protein (DUF2236 family)